MPINYSNLNEQQTQAVNHNEGPALVLAGPGSGKTRVLTTRIARLLDEKKASHNEIMAITFTNKAAKEMRQRVNVLVEKDPPSWIGTFHSTCSKILRIDGKSIGVQNDYNIYDTEDSISIIKQIESELLIDPKDLHPMAVLSTISSAKQELIDENEYDSLKQGPFQDKVSKIYKIYEKRLKKASALDFSDLISKTVELFTKDENVLSKYNERFKYVLVDEYQDTNKAQYVLSKLLSKNRKNIFVVGDMSQAIYSWRGADYRNLTNFRNDFPNCITYNLEQNYRSTSIIIEASKSLIKNNPNNINLDLWTENLSGEKITIYSAYNEKNEADFVCQKILESGVKYSEVGILYRTNAQSRSLEDSLIKHNIPYKIYGGLKFYSRKEIKDILCFLRVIQNPKDEVSWGRIINIPPKGIGEKTFDKIRESEFDLDLIKEKTGIDYKSLNANLSKYKTSELIDKIIKLSGYIDYLELANEEKEKIESRKENIEELKTVANEFPIIQEFLESVALVEDSEDSSEEDIDKVTLMTMHSAKGLEFKHVFLVGVEEGIFPHQRSIEEREKLEEERRLCYVAVTRAKEKLYITYATKREFFGRTSFNQVSRFVSEIPEHLIENNIQSTKTNQDLKTIDDFFSEVGL